MPDVKSITKEEKDTKVKHVSKSSTTDENAFVSLIKCPKKCIINVCPPQVTTLRAAISYISGLQSLLADCEAGLVDPAQFQVITGFHLVAFCIC